MPGAALAGPAASQQAASQATEVRDRAGQDAQGDTVGTRDGGRTRARDRQAPRGDAGSQQTRGDDARPAGPAKARQAAAAVPATTDPPGASRLEDLPGVGPGLQKAILARFRTPQRFLAAVQAMDLQALCEVDGISERRAVDFVRHVRGGASDTAFLGTPAARRIHRDVMERIQAHAATRHGRNRLSLLALMASPEEAQQRMEHVLRLKQEVEALDRGQVHGLLQRLRSLEDPTPRCDTDTLVVAGSHDTMDRLRERGVGRWAMLARADEVDPDVGLVLVTDGGEGGASGLEQAVEVDPESPLADLAPQALLEWVRHNRRVLEACRDLAGLRGQQSRAEAALAALDATSTPSLDEDGIRAAVDEARAEADAAIEARARDLSLSGSELLAAVGSGRLPPALDAVVREALQEARARLRERTGLSFQPYLPGLPVRVDDEELERLLHGLRSRGRVDEYEQARRAARKVAAVQDALRAEVAAWLEYDADFALGCFAAAHDLQRWEAGDALAIEDGLHLGLAADAAAQRVTYHIGRDARVALLTGANSGGKSTLLELVAQAAILARLGLPTPGTCTLPWADELHVVAARQGMDAGAFETFLRSFLPACRGDARRIVLADEVESMTELEAAGRILGHFVGRLARTRSLGIVVTHMAKHVLAHVPDGTVRIDGIEATGLDERHDLVVDRQPRMGRFARSTPELIVERLARTGGADAPLYEELLAAMRAATAANHPETRK